MIFEYVIRRAIPIALLAIFSAYSAFISPSFAAPPKERVALLVANRAYDHTSEVKFAHRDLDAMRKALIDTMGVRRNNILEERDATLTRMKRLLGSGLENVVRTMPADGELIVYYAGHGSREFDAKTRKSRAYLLATDTYPDELKNFGYDLETLKDRLRKLRATYLPEGRVYLILESCFSGESHAGAVLRNRSAPLFGPPVVITDRADSEARGDLVLLAAAGPEEYAVWDTESRQSVFTDALVSGLYGEADEFAGNSDKIVTFDELERFVKRRVQRRLAALVGGARQSPIIAGVEPDAPVVETARIRGIWKPLVKRRIEEQFKADLALRSKSIDQARQYLKECQYCFQEASLNAMIARSERNQIICQFERRKAEDLLSRGNVNQIRAFKPQCPDLGPLQAQLRRKLRLASRFDGLRDRAKRMVRLHIPKRSIAPDAAAIGRVAPNGVGDAALCRFGQVRLNGRCVTRRALKRVKPRERRQKLRADADDRDRLIDAFESPEVGAPDIAAVPRRNRFKRVKRRTPTTAPKTRTTRRKPATRPKTTQPKTTTRPKTTRRKTTRRKTTTQKRSTARRKTTTKSKPKRTSRRKTTTRSKKRSTSRSKSRNSSRRTASRSSSRRSSSSSRSTRSRSSRPRLPPGGVGIGVGGF